MRNLVKQFLAMVFVGSMLTSCLSNVELADEVKAKENQTQILSYFSKLNQTPIAMENGAYYFLTKANSSGELASRGDTLMIHYELANLVTGKVLDSTNRKTNSPLMYQYGFLNPIFTHLESQQTNHFPSRRFYCLFHLFSLHCENQMLFFD